LNEASNIGIVTFLGCIEVFGRTRVHFPDSNQSPPLANCSNHVPCGLVIRLFCKLTIFPVTFVKFTPVRLEIIGTWAGFIGMLAVILALVFVPGTKGICACMMGAMVITDPKIIKLKPDTTSILTDLTSLFIGKGIK
jgi:hypothetical protein